MATSGKRVNWQTKAKTFSLYCAGLTQERLAKEVNVNIRTIQTWITKYNWVESRKELQEIAQKKMQKNVKEIQKGIIKSIYALYAEKNNSLEGRQQLIKELKVSDVVLAMREERVLDGLSSDNLAVIVKEKSIPLTEIEAAVKKLQEKN